MTGDGGFLGARARRESCLGMTGTVTGAIDAERIGGMTRYPDPPPLTGGRIVSILAGSYEVVRDLRVARPGDDAPDACGMGFLASRQGVAERRLVEIALDLCRQFDHRGAPGHGAGLLLDIPWPLLLDRFPDHVRLIAQRDVALGMFFLPWDAGPAPPLREAGGGARRPRRGRRARLGRRAGRPRGAAPGRGRAADGADRAPGALPPAEGAERGRLARRAATSCASPSTRC